MSERPTWKQMRELEMEQRLNGASRLVASAVVQWYARSPIALECCPFCIADDDQHRDGCPAVTVEAYIDQFGVPRRPQPTPDAEGEGA